MTKKVMSTTNQVILVFIALLITWIFTSFYQVYKAKLKPGILLSPDQNKAVELISMESKKQLLLHFYKLGGIAEINIASFSDSSKVQYSWTDDHNLSIRFDSLVHFTTKETNLYYFGDSVNIQYNLKN